MPNPLPLPPQAELHRIFTLDALGVLRWRARPEMPLWWNRRYAGRPAGSVHHKGYVFVRLGKLNFSAHRLVWAYMHGAIPEGFQIDHKEPVKADNAPRNLRPATRSQNKANGKRYRNNTSGFKGVHYNRRQRNWQAHIGAGAGKKLHLGTFKTPEEAHAAYVQAAKERFGEFARFF
jgi:HNH endonuclease/AP2 domain